MFYAEPWARQVYSRFRKCRTRATFCLNSLLLSIHDFDPSITMNNLEFVIIYSICHDKGQNPHALLWRYFKKAVKAPAESKEYYLAMQASTIQAMNEVDVVLKQRQLWGY